VNSEQRKEEVGAIFKSPHINLPLSGEVPRRGGGGTEGAFSTVLNNGILAVKRANTVRPYGLRFIMGDF